MYRYCLFTRLAEKPDVCLYYLGAEENTAVAYALNTIVSPSKDEAMTFDKDTAIILCARLNEDKDSLAESGFTEFELCETSVLYII